MINNFTLISWIYLKGEKTGLIINKENSYRYARFSKGNIKWSFKNLSPGWSWVDTNGNAPLNKWSNVAITYSSTAVIKTYINGSLVHIYYGSGDVKTSTNNLTIGGIENLESVFNGIIDEIRIYKRALSADEIRAIYEATK